MSLKLAELDAGRTQLSPASISISDLAAEAARIARAAGWSIVVSARSGETEDNWLSDLSVGWQGDALKVGSITRSERLAKWNRLLAIERETGLPLTPWPNH